MHRYKNVCGKDILDLPASNRWTCSLQVGHKGDHQAHPGNNLEADCLCLWDDDGIVYGRWNSHMKKWVNVKLVTSPLLHDWERGFDD